MSWQYRETRLWIDKFWVALEIERGLVKLVIDLVHGFEGVVFEDFLANLVPEIFLRVELRRVLEFGAGFGRRRRSIWPDLYQQIYRVGCAEAGDAVRADGGPADPEISLHRSFGLPLRPLLPRSEADLAISTVAYA
jgi:hypothetical protein